MEQLTIKTVCIRIWSLEQKYDLLDKEIKGVKVWQQNRVNIYYEITEKLGLSGQRHSISSKRSKINNMFKYIYNSIFFNPLIGKYNKKIMIFSHPRKKKVDGEFVDIYTKYLASSLKNDSYEILEEPYLNTHYTNRNELSNKKYLDFFNICTFIYRKVSPFKLDKKEKLFIKTLENEINKEFGVAIDLINLFSKSIKAFKIRYMLFDKLFKKRKPSKIFLVVSYGLAPLIAAAKDNGIEVIEIQHGVISKYHLGYNFPSYKGTLKYFPDKIYSFGQCWKDSVEYPISDDKIELYGYPYLKDTIKNYTNIKKKKNQIIFLSQGAIGKEMSCFALKIAKLLSNSNYSIIYKLHPGEYDRWKSIYPDLVLANEYKNVTVIDNNEKELYAYLAESEYQVGVFSTAIYEGLTFKCKTILLDLPGVEYLDFLVERKIVTKVSNDKDFYSVLSNFTSTFYQNDYFFYSK